MSGGASGPAKAALEETRVGWEATPDLVSQLQDLVQSLPVGSNLPAEATLAQQYGVSRLTIREALKILTGRGLTQSRRGRRAVVTEPSSQVISLLFESYVQRDPSALLELVEVRQALEVRSVKLAASKATRAGLQAMEASLHAMKAAAEELTLPETSLVRRDQARSAFQQSDLSFHAAVALASGNRMLAHVLEALEDPLRRTFDASFDGHLLQGGSPLDAYEAHLQIFKFVVARDATNASKSMGKHLQQSEKDLLAYITGANAKASEVGASE